MKSRFLVLAAFLVFQSEPPRYTNHLVNEKSPYLQLHAHNPVDWYPWGDEALQKSRREQKPILLSVGYSTCHWCRVMERESFADPAIAELMNRNFISIKVDREERPDIDRVYLTFLQLSAGGVGYPMTIFLAPDLKPFFGGTYFPKEEGTGLPSFRNVLMQLAKAWDDDRESVLKSANGVGDALQDYVQAQASGTARLNGATLDRAYARLRSQYDKVNGGFGDKPKYAQPVILNFLLRYYARTGQREALNMTLNSLRAIAGGGIHDQVGAGFYRYAVDAAWRVPHFEKMLYDQAQLALSYAEAYQVTHDRFYAGVARETLDYMLQNLHSPEGAFYSAQDADSLVEQGKTEIGEGVFYLWSAEAIQQVLGQETAAVVTFYYGLEAPGILYVNHSLAETAARFRKSERETTALLSAARKKMFEARSRRPEPGRDDKVLTAWNGLAISAFARAAQVFDAPAYEKAATTAATFLRSKLYDAKDGRLKRRYREEEAAVDGFLDDYAFLIQGLLDLYETSFDVKWLSWAVQLQQKQDQLFWDGRKAGYFATAGGDSSVLFQMRDDYDGAEPSANSVSGMNLVRLWQMTDREEWKERADKTFAAFSSRLQDSPEVLPQLMAALDFSLSKPKQIIIAGRANAADTRALLRLVHERYLPNKFLILADGGEGQRQIATWLRFVDSIRQKDGKATAYICENYICKLPTTDPQVVARLLEEK
jgi:hypothetical protein